MARRVPAQARRGRVMSNWRLLVSLPRMHP
jgi:hypothetical protein